MHGRIQHYLPMIVLELHDTGEEIIILITDPGIFLQRHDVLCTTADELFLINELRYTTDFFEDYIYVNIIPLVIRQAIDKSITVNTELKILAHATVKEG